MTLPIPPKHNRSSKDLKHSSLPRQQINPTTVSSKTNRFSAIYAQNRIKHAEKRMTAIQLRYLTEFEGIKIKEQIMQQSGGNTRALASLSLICAGVWMVPSGIALHIAWHDELKWWSHLFMSLHNVAAIIFVIATIVHITLNWEVLTHYLEARTGKHARFKREMTIAVLGVSGIVLLVASHVFFTPP